MKIYTTKNAPNPAALEAVVGIKQMDIETQMVDLMGGENRGDAFCKINPAGQLPCLQLDDGTVIAEVAAIAEYLEELKPDPILCGADARERAITRMRMRQVDYLIIAPMMAGFRNGEGKDFFASRMAIHEALSAPSKSLAADGLAWLDGQMQGCDYICGQRLTYVDCCFYPIVNMMQKLGQPLDTSLKNLPNYMTRLAAHEIIGKVR